MVAYLKYDLDCFLFCFNLYMRPNPILYLS